MEITLQRTNAENADFRQLVKKLDSYLAVTDGEEHDFYHQFNGLEDIKYVVLVEVEGRAVACGAIKHYDDRSVEVKRMFTEASVRGRGVAGEVLKALEAWSRELGYERCVLETGWRQKAAVRLYQKSGYEIIPNYGQYIGMENSVCMAKSL
jgi:putative acetyltransferase